MNKTTISVMPTGVAGAELVDAIVDLDRRGIEGAWLGTGVGMDSLTLFAGALAKTQRIQMGSAIIHTGPRHPVTVAQQVSAIEAIAPGRFRLGLGPGNTAMMRSIFGMPFEAPLSYLEEYVGVIKRLLAEGTVEHEGPRIEARASLAVPAPNVPVLVSGVRTRAFEMAGRATDGVITFLCPPEYHRDVAVPALDRGARSAGRARPALVANVPVCVHDNVDEVRQAVRARLAFSLRSGSAYAAMLVAAGFPEAEEGEWSDAMIDASIVYGDETEVAQRIRHFVECGVTEFSAWLLPAGPDEASSRQRTLDAITRLASDS